MRVSFTVTSLKPLASRPMGFYQSGIHFGRILTIETACQLHQNFGPRLVKSDILSRLQLASANRVASLTSGDGILWIQGIPNVKNRYRKSIENAYYRLTKGCRRDKFVIRSVTDVLHTQSSFVKCVGGSACGLTPPPPQILQTYFGPEVRQ